ncbi:GSCFA domain-containing protein [Sphingomonas sp. TDK1]|uniref:GSCFA domain-containing protein n=1 Tax=Sphingomonas sp. TDK1 TaxID=453247 RepID=UPI0007D925B6|nr:GSCFA domain-containing protein [Sphingomonas sp. TDK1]OAN58371.1 GSCFA domain-containing protein [Sphingomonas sp. TDK1]
MADLPTFPYRTVPDTARWSTSISGRSAIEIDPHHAPYLRINPEDRVASAGSCFAQRISQSLQSSGYNYLITEKGPPFLNSAKRHELGYGVYSARHGNIYTALQLLQLFQRAFGGPVPHEPIWRLADGHYADPFRPSVQIGGFQSEEECLRDRASHLAAVRQMFLDVDVFIFTLGLTEAWYSMVDGAVFPTCPGSVLGGTYDPARHAFINFSVDEVTAHLEEFREALGAVNPKAQILLTVSPVPLQATFEPRHVLQSTVYSKSVLRVVCENMVRRHANVHYFGSYEIVVATGDSKSYFLDDHRTVSDTAVAHVLQCFHRQFTGAGGNAAPAAAPDAAAVRTMPKPMCDEDLVMAALADQIAGRPQ